MCRSIKTLRGPEIVVSAEEIEAAALQFVRKISGYRKPSRANEKTFNRAVREISRSSRRLLNDLADPTTRDRLGEDLEQFGGVIEVEAAENLEVVTRDP